ncbi:MAG: transposase [Clostridiales bacterium]|nr:transposase [Clostridiales bacterium]
MSAHTELTSLEILNIYAKRWNIEVFFRNCKQKLAFDKCQLREKTGHYEDVAHSFVYLFSVLHRFQMCRLVR